MTTLQRRLGLVDATWIGLGSMVGAGVFAVWPAAAASGGSWLPLSLAIAGVVAVCNALSTAQLAARYPAAGGAYVYGRERLGEWAGFAAGWSFVVGKTASVAAMATAFAAYLAPAGWQRPVGIAAVLAVAAVNSFGITRTARAAMILVVPVLAALLLVAGYASVGPSASGEFVGAGPYGVLQAAALLFFAFAGYARVATLGEEVRDPARTIPRAVVIALAIVLCVMAAVAAGLMRALGAHGIARSSAPLADAVAQHSWMVPVVVAAAAIASLGAMLSLLAGVSRTVLAMARERDLPRPLARIDRGVPLVAEWTVAALVCALVATTDLRTVIGFSSFGVLLYYGVANAAALTQPRAERLVPRAIAALGLLGCAVLASAVPASALIGGVAVLVVGLLGRAVRRRFSRVE